MVKEKTKAELARDWVNGNSAAAVAVVLGTSLVPGAASAVLISQELYMAWHIGSIYKADITQADVGASVAAVGLAAVAGPIIALEAAILLGPAAFYAKPVIAAGIIKTIGELLIQYFEAKYNTAA